MTPSAVPLALRVAGTDEVLTVRPERLVVAGYTGRDEAAVAAHIAELAAIGVPPPPTVPTFYDLDPGLLSTGPVMRVPGPATSGEVEPVLVRHAGRHFLAVGSDHTDRDLERTDIAASKAACGKPLGTVVLDLGPDLERFSESDWAGLTATCTADGRTYQQGSVSALRHPRDVLRRMTDTLGELTGDLVLFLGTLPLLDGSFVYADRWHLRLEPPGHPALTLDYHLDANEPDHPSSSPDGEERPTKHGSQ